MEKELFDYFEKEGKLTSFDPMQIEKFKICCKRAADDNPGLNISQLIRAGQIYYYLIDEFPNCTL